MTILKKNSETCRLVQKKVFVDGYIVARQRKRFFLGFSYWRTVAWLYSFQYNTIREFDEWMDWKEEELRGWKYGTKQF